MNINRTLRALSDPTRRRILDLLKAGDLTAGELADHFDLAKSTMSGHFSVLRDAGLIVSERNRNTIVYSINTGVFDDAAASVMALFETSSRDQRHEIPREG
ncbi:transcriptional repressor SdpR [bacterium BMS3Abin02]|nr:transcriptional repressor SdpR [bacterium BMS3Abin02]HDH27221.1 ArsR family transcriptional regulator [Actinomycetota bacterium]HDK46011.1 ArsR family transcriptional regulator [Actinomycetota bacterium]HDL48338.1 ArsR family transcriptional regulator [Actinomycetota bacterium]